MSINITFTQETDPEPEPGYEGDYLDITVCIDDGDGDCPVKVEYTRPIHLNTTVKVGGCSSGQAVLPLTGEADELDTGRILSVDGVNYEVLSVDSDLDEVTLTTNLSSALSGGESVITTDATVTIEIEADLTGRGYTW